MVDLVGVPYLAHGRDYSGADCWGVVFLYYRDVLRLPIPSYSAEMDRRAFDRRDIGPLIDAERALHWEQIDGPDVGSVVLMRAGRHNSHVGISLGANQLLHSEGPGPCVIERLDSLRIKNRISGYFRLKRAD